MRWSPRVLAQLRVDLTNEIDALRRTMTNWMVTVLLAVLGAVVGVAIAF